jgi:hypothetical protein
MCWIYDIVSGCEEDIETCWPNKTLVTSLGDRVSIQIHMKRSTFLNEVLSGHEECI